MFIGLSNSDLAIFVVLGIFIACVLITGGIGNKPCKPRKMTRREKRRTYRTNQRFNRIEHRVR